MRDFPPALAALATAHRCLQIAAAELTIAGALAAPGSALRLDCHVLAQAVEGELTALDAIGERHGDDPRLP
jgi:hypothetical protein